LKRRQEIGGDADPANPVTLKLKGLESFRRLVTEEVRSKSPTVLGPGPIETGHPVLKPALPGKVQCLQGYRRPVVSKLRPSGDDAHRKRPFRSSRLEGNQRDGLRIGGLFGRVCLAKDPKVQRHGSVRQKRQPEVIGGLPGDGQPTDGLASPPFPFEEPSEGEA
jgi:hypothetical protein